MSSSISTQYSSERSAKESYILSRIESQIAYFDRKSIQHKKTYYRMTILTLALNALIPILSLYINTENNGFKLAITCLSSLTTVLTGCSMLFNSKSLWIKFRKRETYLSSLLHQYYVNTANGDPDDAAFKELVAKSEALLIEDADEWASLVSKETGKAA